MRTSLVISDCMNDYSAHCINSQALLSDQGDQGFLEDQLHHADLVPQALHEHLGFLDPRQSPEQTIQYTMYMHISCQHIHCHNCHALKVICLLGLFIC